jgi:hypothetical protein
LQCTQQYKNHHRTGKEKHVQKKIATWFYCPYNNFALNAWWYKSILIGDNIRNPGLMSVKTSKHWKFPF